MRDNKKDAQDLRRIAKFQNCFECYEGERTEGSCSSRCTLSKAADAIEELLAFCRGHSTTLTNVAYCAECYEHMMDEDLRRLSANCNLQIDFGDAEPPKGVE